LEVLGRGKLGEPVYVYVGRRVNREGQSIAGSGPKVIGGLSKTGVSRKREEKLTRKKSYI